MARIESTGWRDEALSRRHREWGVDTPAVDLDCVLCEFHLGRAVALIEYKVQNLRGKLDLGHPMYRALVDLADRAGVPAVIAFYWPELWAFELLALNALAEEIVEPGRVLSEREFVTWLYRVRSRTVRDDLLATLSTLKPTRGVA